MKTFPDETIDLIATDPPYGLEFMGKDWDRAVPSVEAWTECVRVLKSGAFAFILCIPRLDCLSQMAVNLKCAGFEIGFTPIYWAYASGFPKAENISKAVDKKLGLERERHRAFKTDIRSGSFHAERENSARTMIEISDAIPISEEAKTLDGSYGGFQPKPAVEVIIVAMKPLSEKTYVDQALANGKGVTWLDPCRIPFQSTSDFSDALNAHREPDAFFKQDGRSTIIPSGGSMSTERGRFPANLLCLDDALNDGTKTLSNGGTKPIAKSSEVAYGEYKKEKVEYYNYGDSGSFSRYFDLDAWFQKNLPESARKTFPFLIVPKASKQERNQGLENLPEVNAPIGNYEGRDLTNPKNILRKGMQDRKSRNFHPCVKPIKLMSYLITLGSRPDDTVLDPFCGSGSTLIAAKVLSRRWIGIDINLEYVQIAKKRVSAIPEPLSTFGEDWRIPVPKRQQT